MATVNGYRSVGLRGGLIAPGYLGDVTVLDIKDPRINPLNKLNVVNNIVYSSNGGMVKYLVVNGKVVYGPHNREELIERALVISRELNEYLWGMLND
jgi:cytosine/adenosine deaminase-related metal-dependent hydrolase